MNHSSNEDEISQEYRETILLSKYLLKLKVLIVVCLYLFSTKCQKCLEKYRSNSVSYGLPYKVLIPLYGYQLCRKHQPRQVPLNAV